MQHRKNDPDDVSYIHIRCVNSREQIETSSQGETDKTVLFLVTGKEKEVWISRPEKGLQPVITRDKNNSRTVQSENLFLSTNPDSGSAWLTQKEIIVLNRLIKKFSIESDHDPEFWEVFVNVINQLLYKPNGIVLPESEKEMKDMADDLRMLCYDDYITAKSVKETVLLMSKFNGTEDASEFLRKLNNIILDHETEFTPEIYANTVHHILQWIPGNTPNTDLIGIVTNTIENLLDFPGINLDCATALYLIKTLHNANAFEFLIISLKDMNADKKTANTLLRIPEVQKTFFMLDAAERKQIDSLLREHGFNDIASEFDKAAQKKSRIALSYNPETGGSTIPPITSALLETGAMPQFVDYRKILPTENIPNDLFSNPEQLRSVFAQAKAVADEMLAGMDALLVPGNNAMVQPELYGESPSPLIHTDPGRAIAEMAMIHIAIQKGMPILGICGGHQILNVYLGGRLTDLTENEKISQSHMDYGNVIFDPASEIGKIIIKEKGLPDEAEVIQSFFGAHSQKVIHPGGKDWIASGDYLQVVATSDEKNENRRSIEAVESTAGVPVKGLQFHPEIGSKGFISSNEILTDKRGISIAQSEEAIKINMRIFREFEQAAKTYHHKNETLPEIRKKRFTEEKDENSPTSDSSRLLTSHGLFSPVEPNLSEKTSGHTDMFRSVPGNKSRGS